MKRLGALGVGTMLLLAVAIPASAAKATPTLTQTTCAPNGGPDVRVTVTWSGVTVNAWSVGVLRSDGQWDYGIHYQQLPKPVSSGSQSHTFAATDAFDGANAIFSVGYIYMGSTSNIQNAKGFPGGAGGENRPASGWPAC